MRRGLIGIAFFCAWLFGVLGTSSAADFFADQLARLKVGTSPSSLAVFLQSQIPTAKMEEEIQSLIANLGSAKFTERQQAMQSLIDYPWPPIEQLEAAMRSPDPEVRVRCRRALATINQQEYRAKLVAVFNYVEHHQVKGLAPQLLQILPRLHDRYLFHLAERALRASVRPEDAELLRHELTAAADPQKESIVLALGTALSREALPELQPLLSHSNLGLRLAAAEAMAELGERETLPVLIELLSSPNLAHRQKSATVLRGFTGRRFGFSPGGEAQARQPAVEAWKTWYAEEGQTAKLIFPIPRQPVEQGRTLVCVWGAKTFKEVTEQKTEVFAVDGFSYVWGCHGTPEGRRFVVDAEKKAVFEYDGFGRVVWQRINLPGRPTGVEGLDNGNVLVACSDSDRVVELAPDGQIVWNLHIEGRPTTAQRLPSGNTIINLQNAGKVVEVDSQSNITVLVNGLDRAHTAQLIDNGNVLVTEMRLNRVNEYDRNGQIVWTKTELKNPAQAQRLSNGNTLIADEDGLHEFDPDKNRLWHLEVTRSRFFRY